MRGSPEGRFLVKAQLYRRLVVIWHTIMLCNRNTSTRIGDTMFLRGRGVIGLIFAAAMLVLPASQAGGQVRSDQWNSMSAKQLESGIEKQHPAAYFILAQKLYGEGRRDDATMWFYIGQIRYRAYLITNPNLNPSGDPAVFSSLFNTIGPVINGYAFGDIPQLLKIIDRAKDVGKLGGFGCPHAFDLGDLLSLDRLVQYEVLSRDLAYGLYEVLHVHFRLEIHDLSVGDYDLGFFLYSLFFAGEGLSPGFFVLLLPLRDGRGFACSLPAGSLSLPPVTLFLLEELLPPLLDFGLTVRRGLIGRVRIV